MVEVMEHLHKYIPERIVKEHYVIDDIDMVIEKSSISPVLFGGDQLTASRARSAKKAKINSTTSSKRMDGLVPVAEDWHTKLTLLSVSSYLRKLTMRELIVGPILHTMNYHNV